MKPVVEIIVNKNWETEPVLNAMTNPKIKPVALPFPSVINTPKPGDYRMKDFRAVFNLEHIDVQVRCIEDIMDIKAHPSSSEEKYRVLPGYIQQDNPALVISISTAESTPVIQPSDTSKNGSVFIGGVFYMYDGRKFDPKSTSNLKITKELRENNVPDKIYALVNSDFRKKVLAKFISAQKFPAKELSCSAQSEFVSIGVVNITNYEAYKNADPAAYREFMLKYKTTHGKAATIETTHGIVRMSSGDRPVLFVSPITDRYEHFDEDATDTQNYIAAFNAGITVGELVCAINEHVGKGGVLTSGE